jgi:hypothetical protein
MGRLRFVGFAVSDLSACSDEEQKPREMEIESKTGAKPTRTPPYRSTKDTGNSLTMQHYCLSAEISGLQVRVLPGSPLLLINFLLLHGLDHFNVISQNAI